MSRKTKTNGSSTSLATISDAPPAAVAAAEAACAVGATA